MANGVLILAELADGKVAPVTAELVGAAQRLGAGPVSAMVIGSGVEGAAASVAGVEKTYVVDDAALAEYTTDGYTQAAAAVVAQADPAIILLGQTNIGRDLAPALSYKLGTAVAMDTTSLEMKDGKLHTTRPAYGGNARAVNSFAATPAIATVRPEVAGRGRRRQRGRGREGRVRRRPASARRSSTARSRRPKACGSKTRKSS